MGDELNALRTILEVGVRKLRRRGRQGVGPQRGQRQSSTELVIRVGNDKVTVFIRLVDENHTPRRTGPVDARQLNVRERYFRCIAVGREHGDREYHAGDRRPRDGRPGRWGPP